MLKAKRYLNVARSPPDTKSRQKPQRETAGLLATLTRAAQRDDLAPAGHAQLCWAFAQVRGYTEDPLDSMYYSIARTIEKVISNEQALLCSLRLRI